MLDLYFYFVEESFFVILMIYCINFNFGNIDFMIELFIWIFILFLDEEWLCFYGLCL